jgi:hypothetical protein
MFQALTEKGPDNREARRPTTVATLAQVTGVPFADIILIVAHFRRPGRSFLMPPAGVALDENSVIDISHESLIRGWQRLRKWVDEESESAKIYRRLAKTAALHREGRRGSSAAAGWRRWRSRSSDHSGRRGLGQSSRLCESRCGPQ